MQHGAFSACVVIAVALHAIAAASTEGRFHFPGARGKKRIGRELLSASASSMVYASRGQLSGNFPVDGNASVPKKAPLHHVELLRFVTAYRTGIEALVDVTPYTPLLHAAIRAGNLTVYNFLDTWVSNNTEQNILYMSNETGKCYLQNTSQGNGWTLTAHLIFYPHQQAVNTDHSISSPIATQQPGTMPITEYMETEQVVSTMPRESVTLSPGWYGGNIPIGRVGYHTANLSDGGTAVLLDKPLDFSTIKTATVYDLPSNEAGLARLLGFVSQQVELFTRSGNADALNILMEEARESLLWQGLAQVHVEAVDNFLAVGKYNGSKLH
jgi:hypothetical protein